MGAGGWVRAPGAATGNAGSSADPEILVAFAGTASIQGWISSFRWSSSVQSEASPTAISILMNCSENVTVVGSPTITVTNTGSGSAATVTCTYASGSGTEQLTFTSGVPAAGALDEDDVLNIAANATALAGGSLTGADGAILITNVADEGLRGGTNTGGNANTSGTTAGVPTDGGAKILVVA